ncbi:MAG: VWA domain-containing protein [Betaproteobacteria bacterium]|nr:VWA domain-containing protein [Betaproteobacteria bacterium]
MLIVKASSTIDAGATLRGRLTGFAGFLRANGYGVGGADCVSVLETTVRTGVLDSQILRWSLKALLCGRGDEWRRFDALFDAYFLPPNKKIFVDSNVVAAGAHEPRGETGERSENEPVSGAGHGVAGDTDSGAARHGASREESLASTDFRQLNQAEHAREVEALMRRFARRLKHLHLRREMRFHHGRRLDLQGTIRRSVASGGTPLRLAWRERRRVRPRLLLLLDVSRSMSLYSFFYLRLARALCGELADVHCFIFHTRITGVAEALRDPDPWRSQERLHLLAAGWGGGTRIGECLWDFNRDHGARLVHSRTGVIIVSDGYDTGEPEVLSQALAALRRRSRRMVWLNPLLNQPGFSPESRGMLAAMPHLDLLAPGADLAGIERVLPQVIEALR